MPRKASGRTLPPRRLRAYLDRIVRSRFDPNQAHRRSAGVVVLILGVVAFAPMTLAGADQPAGIVVPAQEDTVPTTETTTSEPTTTTTEETTTTTTEATTTTTTTAPSTTTTTTTTTTLPTTTTTTRPPSSTTTTTSPFPTTTTLATTTTTVPGASSTSSTTTTTTRGTPRTTTTRASNTGPTNPGESTTTTVVITDITITSGEDAEEPLGDPEGTPATVGRFSVSPVFSEPGGLVTIQIAFDRVVPGLEVVVVLLDGVALGSPIDLGEGQVRVERAIPEMEAGEYQVTLNSGDRVLASVDFEVLRVAEAAVLPSWLWWALPLGALVMWLAWLAADRRKPVNAPNPIYASALAGRPKKRWLPFGKGRRLRGH